MAVSTPAKATPTKGERLARIEAFQVLLVREIRHIRDYIRDFRIEMRVYFIALLLMTVALWVTMIMALTD